ncbi:protoporphyrinogen oxidase HemJ [Marinihelvus fidelis]|uniref:Protoporphyrinogen IX oxidase n=1 Tax=Marinihelvus fidelis TaxID=2613842 RepID=A0A5N0T7S1_9GAMM|nr:protoporphyrinogen oxidase HemJ [Marinihelvus fidelis]KAA9130970.1 protoporphyrinogen oxidase HemJ [Marinihelvus fidelis]
MLWLKAFHIIFMVTWFAGLFYLPRLFVYHAQTEDESTSATFKVMERKLMVMTHIGGALTWAFGLALIHASPWVMATGWLRVKLMFVIALTAYHVWCIYLVKDFAADRNTRSHKWYRWFNEAPALALVVVIILAVTKPF